MKYMILLYGSQQDYDALSGRPSVKPAWSPRDFAAMGAFMEAFNQSLVDSGELVETRGLTAPAHARRIQLQNGVPVVTDGPYAETQEVLAGYWIVECESPRSCRPGSSRLLAGQIAWWSSRRGSGSAPLPACDRGR
jgi:hypothetical protein